MKLNNNSMTHSIYHQYLPFPHSAAYLIYYLITFIPKYYTVTDVRRCDEWGDNDNIGSSPRIHSKPSETNSLADDSRDSEWK